MIEKHDLCVPKPTAKPLRKTVASESIKKPRNNVRQLHEHFGKTYKWTYIKFTPSGYMWKPKSTKENVNPNVSMPLGNTSRTANAKDTMTSRRSTVSNIPLSSNSYAAHRDCSIHPPDLDEVIHLEKESRSKLSNLIRPFDYDKLNNLYDLFIPQQEKSSEQRYFSERSRLSHINVNNGKSEESFNKQTTLLEKRMDESIPLDKKRQSSLEIFKVKT
nr:hypothetical protein [Tanacetum cinerariifolium]